MIWRKVTMVWPMAETRSNWRSAWLSQTVAREHDQGQDEGAEHPCEDVALDERHGPRRRNGLRRRDYEANAGRATGDLCAAELRESPMLSLPSGVAAGKKALSVPAGRELSARPFPTTEPPPIMTDPCQDLFSQARTEARRHASSSSPARICKLGTARQGARRSRSSLRARRRGRRVQGQGDGRARPLAPADTDLDRLVVVGAASRPTSRSTTGCGSAAPSWARSARAKPATVLLERPDGAQARRRRGRRFRARHASSAPTPSTNTRTTSDENGRTRGAGRRSRSGSPTRPQPRGRLARAQAVADGVTLARDLVNEPAERARTGRVRRPRQGTEGARRRGRGLTETEMHEARHGRAARRRAGLAAAAAPGRHALERRQARQGRRRRSPSSARASSSTPAASRSSRPPAWRT